MKKSKSILALIVLAILASNTACTSQNKEDIEDLVESSAVTSGTMASTTIQKATEPVVIVQETMPEIITTPTEAITELEKGIEYLRGLHSVRITYSTYYLKMDQEAQLRDMQAADGILLEDLGTITLLAGTVLTPLQTSGELSSNLSSDNVFVLIDGRCVTFDMSTDEDGGLRVNGYPAEKVLGSATHPSYPDWIEKEEGQLRAMEAPEWGVVYHVLTISTDWNEDGVKDTFRRELDDDYEGSNGTLIFTDGATGESTDVTDRLIGPDGDYNEILTEGVFLYEDRDGNRMIMDSFDVCSSDYSTFVYTYDPEKIIVMQEFAGVFDIEDGEMFLERGSTIFGNLENMIYPVTIADGQFTVAEKSTELYWQASWNMDSDSEYPNIYSCTLQEITAERMIGDAIQTFTIPAGMAIFPLYTVVDESGAGVLYFRTVTDDNCQISYMLEDNGWNPLFGGLEQRDLFWCAFGG